MIIRVPAEIKTWGDAVRCESLGFCHRQSTVIGPVGITGNNVCLTIYHWQMDFSVLRQCFSSGTAPDSHTQYKARPSQNWPKITTYDHVYQIFITFCTWFRRGVLCDQGFRHCCPINCHICLIIYIQMGQIVPLNNHATIITNQQRQRRILPPDMLQDLLTPHWPVRIEFHPQKCILNSLSLGRYGCNFECVNFKFSMGIDILCFQVNITNW